MEFAKKFFDEETLEGFTVSRLMKRTWAAELELLKLVIDICNRNGLEYFADWGTLLGAVRHKGFVPWDDDIDICMKREDYDRLTEILPQELPRGFRAVGVYTENSAPFIIDTMQLRVLAYRGDWERNEYMRFLHGYPFEYIAIDVFPLDVVPCNTKDYELQNQLITMAQSIYTLWEQLREEKGLKDALKRFGRQCDVKIPFHLPEKEQKVFLLRTIDALSALYQGEDGDRLAEHAFAHRNPRYVMKKEWYESAVMMPFENLDIAVPCGYDEVLTAKYGNYHEMSRDRGGHGYPFYKDMEKSFAKEISEAGYMGTVDELCDKVLSGEINLV